MSVKILIPTPLRPYAGKESCIQFDARTVGEALDLLTGRFAELRKHLYSDEGRLRNFVNVYVNDEDIRSLQKESTPLKEGDIISIIPSIAGGVGATLRSPSSLVGLSGFWRSCNEHEAR